MGKPTICIGEDEVADQLRGDREADQHLCFRCTDRLFNPSSFLNPKFQASSYLFSVAVLPGMCRTCSKTTLLVIPRGGSFVVGCPWLPM